MTVTIDAGRWTSSSPAVAEQRSFGLYEEDERCVRQHVAEPTGSYETVLVPLAAGLLDTAALLLAAGLSAFTLSGSEQLSGSGQPRGLTAAPGRSA